MPVNRYALGWAKPYEVRAEISKLRRRRRRLLDYLTNLDSLTDLSKVEKNTLRVDFLISRINQELNMLKIKYPEEFGFAVLA